MMLALLLPLAAALSPSDTFPSCLEAGLSWAEAGVSSLTTNVTSPEACQKLCDEASVCLGFTWLSADFPLLRLSCLLFEKTDTEIPCQNCVSGTDRCSCSVPGECEVIDNNLVDVAGGMESARDCEEFCIATKGCNFYTYFGNDNPLRHTCFLFKTCDAYVSECDDCMTGMTECNICSFEDTLADGSCDKSCDDGWSSFNDACYIILNNNNGQYNHIDVCREECTLLGGSLGSIHSAEENTFIYNLLRPARSGTEEQLTWLGAEWVSDNTFRWEDGTPWDYTNWDSGEPDGASSSGCVFLGYDLSSPGRWEAGVCDYNQAVFDCLCKIIL